MNVRLKYYIEFPAGVYFQGQVTMTTYRVTLNLLTATHDGEDQNIALDRIKYFVYKCLHSTIFIDVTHKEQCEALSKTGIRITSLPAEPFDQVVGIMLYSKLNAIAEDRMLVTDIELSSDIGDNVVYLHSDQESIGMFEDPGWWHESDLMHCHRELLDDEKVMSINNYSVWRELNLGWAEEESQESGNTIVFADFNRNDTK